jgi:predicted CopG family antitoxin
LIRFSDEEIEMLNKIKEQLGVSFSEAIRRGLKLYAKEVLGERDDGK